MPSLKILPVQCILVQTHGAGQILWSGTNKIAEKIWLESCVKDGMVDRNPESTHIVNFWVIWFLALSQEENGRSLVNSTHHSSINFLHLFLHVCPSATYICQFKDGQSKTYYDQASAYLEKCIFYFEQKHFAVWTNTEWGKEIFD